MKKYQIYSGMPIHLGFSLVLCLFQFDELQLLLRMSTLVNIIDWID